MSYSIAIAAVGFAIELVIRFWRDVGAIMNSGVLRGSVWKIFN